MAGISCPECGQGKHINCTGWALNANDDMVACACGTDGHPERRS